MFHHFQSKNDFAVSKVQQGATTWNMLSDQATESSAPILSVTKQIQPQSATVAWGTFADYSLDPSTCDVLQSVYLKLSVAALTAASGTVAFVNDGQNFLIRAELSHGPNIINTIYPESSYLREISELSSAEKRRLLPMAGNATSANRITFSTSGGNYFIRLNFPAITDGGQGLPIAALNGPLRVRLYYQDQTLVINKSAGGGTALTLTGAITASQLYVNGYMFQSDASRQALINTLSKNAPVMFRTAVPVQQPRTTVPSGSTTVNIPLNAFVGPFSHLFFIARLASDLSTAGAVQYDNYQVLSTITLKSASGQILPAGVATDCSFNLACWSESGLYGDGTDVASTLGGTAKNAYLLSFADNITGVFQGEASGYYQMSGFEQCTLTMPTTGAAWVVDVIGYRYSYLSLNGNGQLESLTN